MSRENGLRGVGTKDRGRVLALGVAARFRALVGKASNPSRARSTHSCRDTLFQVLSW
jgi:hypothetical protein